MPPPGFDPQRTAAEAAAWNVRLDCGELTDADRTRLHEWLATPGNAREYDAQRQLLGWIQDLPADVKEDLERNLFMPAERAPSGRWRPLPLWVSGLAASFLLVAILGGLLWRTSLRFLSHSYASGVGEVRTFGLPDGSTTALNTRTRLRWVGSDHERRVKLLGGEVLFEVRHDPMQPFQIELKHSRITVLGTRFDVYEKPNDDVVVTVVIGKVVVQGYSPSGAWAEQLTANERIEYSPDGSLRRSTVDASTAADWRAGILRTEGVSLESVVGELGRYTSLKIVIEDPSLNALIVGGVFDIHDVPSALERLARSADVPITVARSGDAFILRRGPEPAADGKGS